MEQQDRPGRAHVCGGGAMGRAQHAQPALWFWMAQLPGLDAQDWTSKQVGAGLGQVVL